MKIAVTSMGDNLEAAVDPRFGRCAFFVIVDTETNEFQAIANTAANAGSGAGIQAAQTVANAGAQAVVAGNYGPNAYQALTAGGIKLLTGAAGTVMDAVEAFKAGSLQELSDASVPPHFGMGGGGMGRGGGGGMGRGGGGGMGRGGGRGR